jgi:hypothetical protein
MVKLFFRNLLYILSILGAAFGIFVVLVGCIKLLTVTGGWGVVILMVIGILLVAYVTARKDFNEAIKMEYQQSCIKLGRSYDNMVWALSHKNGEDAESEIELFKQTLAEHIIKFTADDPYAQSYSERYEAMMVFYNLPV